MQKEARRARGEGRESGGGSAAGDRRLERADGPSSSRAELTPGRAACGLSDRACCAPALCKQLIMVYGVP